MKILTSIEIWIRNFLSKNKWGGVLMLLAAPWFLLPDNLSRNAGGARGIYLRFATSASPIFASAALFSWAFSLFGRAMFVALNPNVPGMQSHEYLSLVSNIERASSWGGFGIALCMIGITAVHMYVWHRTVVWIAGKLKRPLAVRGFSYFSLKSASSFAWFSVFIFVLSMIMPYLIKGDPIDIGKYINDNPWAVVVGVIVVGLLQRLKDKNRAKEDIQLYGGPGAALLSSIVVLILLFVAASILPAIFVLIADL